MTHYIRFPDESTGMAALDAAGLLYTDDDGVTHPLTASHMHALDAIGPIYTGGTYDPDTGKVITPPVLLSGWHCNYIGELPEGWDQYLVTPKQPNRIFL
jgi:hypothetical protein